MLIASLLFVCGHVLLGFVTWAVRVLDYMLLNDDSSIFAAFLVSRLAVSTGKGIIMRSPGKVEVIFKNEGVQRMCEKE